MTDGLSILASVQSRKLREWDFLPGGFSYQFDARGEQRHVFSITAPDGSHRGTLHLTEHECEAMKAALKRAGSPDLFAGPEWCNPEQDSTDG